MGLGSSRMGPSPPHLVRPHRRRRSSFKRAVSSLLICGASPASSTSSGEMEDYPAELLVDSAEHGDLRKLKFTRKHSDTSVGCGSELVGIKTANGVSSGRRLHANPTFQVHPTDDRLGYNEECLFESRDSISSSQSVASFEGNEMASTSYEAHHPSSGCPSATEIVAHGAVNGMSCGTSGGSSEVVEALNNPIRLCSHGLEECLSCEVSSESNVSELNDSTNSDCSSASFVSGSPTRFNFLRDDHLQEVGTSSLGLPASEREQNGQDGGLISGDVMGISSSNYTEINSRGARRNNRRLFWDAFSRRTYRRNTDSRSIGFSSYNSDQLRPVDGWSRDLFSDELQEDIRSRRNRTQVGNEHRWNSRSEIWGRLHSRLDSIDHQNVVCPRGIHADGPCSCQPGLSAEASATRAGISRVVLLAEALLEVLDQIYRQPMMLSLSMISSPAPESVVDSFPVKVYSNAEKSGCAFGVTQCYICLDEYEEGDKIRVLPCHHEYHVLCVDKWLKEIHGVCPLCRGDVREGSTGTTVLDQETVSH